jgi:predicted porin
MFETVSRPWGNVQSTSEKKERNMKKVLVASAALMLAGGLYASAASAAAVEPGVKITGDARIRLFYQDDNYGDFGNDDDDSSNTDMDSRVRLNFTGTAAGGAYAKARLRIYEGFTTDIDNDPSTSSLDNSNLWADLAYVGIPFTDQFTLELGKYRSTYGPLGTTYNFFYDDVHSAGGRGIIKVDGVEINPFIEWMEESQTYPTGNLNRYDDNDEIRFGVHAKGKLNKDWTLGGMIGYQMDERLDTDLVSAHAFEKNDGFFGSIYTNGKVDQFGLVAELAVTAAELNNFNSWEEDFDSYTGTADRIGSDDTGFGGYVFPNYQIDKLNIGLNLGMTTGGFQPDRAFGFVMLGSSDNSRISAARIGDTGDWLWAGLVAQYQIDESLKLTGNLVYADIDPWDDQGIDGDGPITSSGALAAALDSAWELSAVLQYTISKGADVYFSAGYLAPSFEDSDLEDDGCFGALTRFELKF